MNLENNPGLTSILKKKKPLVIMVNLTFTVECVTKTIIII